MKNKIVLLSICCLLLAGCGTIPTLKDGSEAVVTLDKGEISVDDLYSEIKDTYGLATLVNMIDKKILEQEYKDDLEDAKSSAESQLEQIKSYYGDDALSAIQQYTGYSSLEAYQDYLYIAYLQNLAVQDYAKEQITESEIQKYYDEEVVGDIKVSHILITPDVTDEMSDEDKEKAETKAKEEADELIKKLKESKNVTDDFKKLAKENSDDEATSEDGGNLGYINKDTLSSDYDGFAEAAYNLKDGEYTAEAVKTSLGYHIILRVKSKDKAALDDVKASIKDTLATNLISEDGTTTVNALQAIRKKYGVKIIDSELEKQYNTYIENALASAMEANNSTEK